MSYAHDVSSVIKYRQRRRLNSLSDRKKSLQANLFYTCHLSHVWSCCQFYVNMSWVKRLMTWVSFVQSSHLPVFPTLQLRPTFKGSDHPSYRKVNLSNYQMTKAMFSRTPMCVNDIPCIIVNCFFSEISSVTTFVTLWIWFLYVSIITYYWWTKCDKPFYNVTSLYKKNKTDTHTHTKKKKHTHILQPNPNQGFSTSTNIGSADKFHPRHDQDLKLYKYPLLMESNMRFSCVSTTPSTRFRISACRPTKSEMDLCEGIHGSHGGCFCFVAPVVVLVISSWEFCCD